MQEFTTFLEAMLQRAEQIKQTPTIEPPLIKSDFPDLLERAQSILSSASSLDSKRHIVETSARDTFNNLLVSGASPRAQEHTSDGDRLLQ